MLPMNESGRMMRKDMSIMMMKSIRPCHLTAGGFFPVIMETSTTVHNHSIFNKTFEKSIQYEQLLFHYFDLTMQ